MLLVVLSPRAELDLIEGEAYYEFQSAGLGRRFIQEVNAALGALSSFYYLPIQYSNVRIKQVKVFPFLIHYVINLDKGIIEVDTIMHARRDSPLNDYGLPRN